MCLFDALVEFPLIPVLPADHRTKQHMRRMDDSVLSTPVAVALPGIPKPEKGLVQWALGDGKAGR